jgi:hypothetical protein
LGDLKDKQVSLAATLAAIVPTVGVVFSMVWYTYAQPKVDTLINKKTAPIEEKVDTLFAMVSQLQKADKQQVFHNQQMIYLLKKIAGKKAVKEMEEETLIFKPSDGS